MAEACSATAATEPSIPAAKVVGSRPTATTQLRACLERALHRKVVTVAQQVRVYRTEGLAEEVEVAAVQCQMDPILSLAEDLAASLVAVAAEPSAERVATLAVAVAEPPIPVPGLHSTQVAAQADMVEVVEPAIGLVSRLLLGKADLAAVRECMTSASLSRQLAVVAVRPRVAAVVPGLVEPFLFVTAAC